MPSKDIISSSYTPNYFDVIPENDSASTILEFELQQLVIGLYLEKCDAVQILNKLRESDERFTSLTINKISTIINKYREDTSKFVDAHPNLLEKRLDLIIRHIQSLDKVEKEQWDLYNTLAADNAKSKVSLLGDIKKTVMEKAKLQQLLGTDTDTKKHLDEAREANHRLVILIKDITNKCPDCKKRLNDALGRNIRIVGA
jgi:GTP1/Obg family GTP-binding protein